MLNKIKWTVVSATSFRSVCGRFILRWSTEDEPGRWTLFDQKTRVTTHHGRQEDAKKVADRASS